MNLTTIADALAARYAPGVVTQPAGRKNITSATSRPPNNIPNTPFVIAWAQTGDVTLEPSRLQHSITFQVTFYYAKSEGDVPREWVALMDWVGVLLGQLYGQQKLGTTGVKKAYVIRWEIGTIVYAGVTYDAITLTVMVDFEENVTVTP